MKFKKYYENNDRTIYFDNNIKEFYINQEKEITLKEYLTNTYQTTDDAYVETTTVSVSPKVSGQIVKVLVEDNQDVKAGTKLKEVDEITISISEGPNPYKEIVVPSMISEKSGKIINISSNNIYIYLYLYNIV